MSRQVSLMSASLLLVAALSACGGDADDPPPTAASTDSTEPNESPKAAETPDLGKPDAILRLKALKGLRFDKERLSAPAGSVAKIVLTKRIGHTPPVPSDRRDERHGPTLALTRTTDDKPPQSDVFAVPEEPGRYMYMCPILGHGLTMRGFLIVK
jgi:plastocyanin